MKVALLASVLCSLFVGTPAPFHASCSVTWTFGVPCSSVSNKILNQIHKWSGPENCENGGEKCLYSLVNNSTSEIKAKHETPVKHYVDDLTFSLSPGGNKCNVKGFSTSETFYAVLDYGTNYCNLHNLVTGSGLNQTTGYTEATSDTICTQYSSANCEKY
ncbi:uncharacterized protein LOC135471644 [Liolophura sinensis]|uniref:uncharacterized protein LOC135471644 n=1 Tax=Liolophura sinensis TaxID=3198878 RepID=UPI0031588844